MNKGNAGFTLTEILLSIVLLGILVLTFTFTFSQGFAGLGKSEEIMNEFYRAESSLINVITSGSTDENTIISAEDITIKFDIYGTEEQIEINNIFKITSSVQYNDGQSIINLYGYIPDN